MKELLNSFDPITLEQMSDIRLMNRTDTKFVTTEPKLRQLLMLAKDDYFVQEIDGERIAPYYTLYFDTDDCAMYTTHESGHTNRQKLRIRSYVNSGLNFLEVKTKNNHGRTKKKRVLVHEFNQKNLFTTSVSNVRTLHSANMTNSFAPIFNTILLLFLNNLRTALSVLPLSTRA